MCVICNIADKPIEETIYIVSQTASGDNFMVPMVSNLFEMHTIQVIELSLIHI